MNLAFHVRIKGKSSRILPPHLMAIANRGVLSTEKAKYFSKFVFQQRCFFINSSSLEFYVFQLEFRGINYCSFFIPPSSLILWPVKVYCFFSSEGVKQGKSKQTGHCPTL